MTQPSLPLAEGLSAGALDNGLMYYVWEHPEPPGYCELRLFVAVGSWCEADTESGFAHFVEHMAFKTTTNFSEQGSIINFLEKKGAQYGHDLNASTGLLETVYKFQIPVSVGLADLADGLTVLADWAFGIQATEQDVESEKPVIREEWRTKRGARERLKAKYWHDAVDPRVAARFPIGDLDVIATATPAELHRFYHTWYRPDLMAVAMVGDFNGCQPAELVTIIKEKFGAAGIRKTPQSPLAPPLPQPGVVKCFLQDAEVTACTAAVELLQPLSTSADVGHLEGEAARRVFLTVLDRRFTSLLRCGGGNTITCPPSVLDLAVGSRPLLPTLLCTSVTATVSTGDGDASSVLHDAIVVLVRELSRIARHGVTSGEIARAASSWQSSFSPDRRVSAAELADDCLQHFRFHGEVPLAGPRFEAAACREFLAHQDNVAAAVQRIADRFSPLSSNEAWRVCVQCGPGLELDIDAIWDAASKAVLADPPPPWVDIGGNVENLAETRQAALQALVPWPSGEADWKCKAMPSIGAVEFTFNNGVVACCLRRDTAEKIALQGFALGGSSELDEADECAMGILDDIALAAGLSDDLDSLALADMQSTTNTRTNTQRHLYHRGIGGSTGTGRLELLLRLVVARLRLPASRFECGSAAHAMARAKARLAEDIRQREHGPHFLLGQRARILSCGGLDIPVLRPASMDAVAALSTERCSRLHARGFAGAPADFLFVLVGDLPQDQELGPLLARSLGSLPGHSGPWLPCGERCPTALPSGFAKGVVSESIRSASAEKATVLLIFHTAVPLEDSGEEHLKETLRIQSACRCAQDRLLERLRLEAGGVYSVSVTFGRTSLSPHGHISIAFDCDPSRHAALTTQALSELEHLRTAGPSSDEATGVSNALIDMHSRNLAGTAANSYWLFYILDAYKGERLRQAKNGLSVALDTQAVEKNVLAASHDRAALLAGIGNSECLRSTFNEYFNLENYVHLVLEPEQNGRL